MPTSIMDSDFNIVTSSGISVSGMPGYLYDPQEPRTHNLAGPEHIATTLAGLNSLISDATLSDATLIEGAVTENMPIISLGTISGDTYQYAAKPGKSSTLALILSDGELYTCTSPVSMDVTTTGLGGLEASAALPPTISGTGDSLSAAVGDVQTVTDAAGLFTSAMVGLMFNITSGAISDERNKGSFEVLSYISPTQITIKNPLGQAKTEAFNWGVYNQWFYGYAVVNSPTAKTFGIILSEKDPSVGPDDYSIYRYVGPICYTGSTNKLKDMVQSSTGEFMFSAQFTAFPGSRTSIDAARVKCYFNDYVPSTTHAMYIRAYWYLTDMAAGTNWAYRWYLTETAPEGSPFFNMNINSNSGGVVEQFLTQWVFYPTAEQILWRYVTRLSGAGALSLSLTYILGFKDKYLSFS